MNISYTQLERLSSECGTTMIRQPSVRRRRQVNEDSDYDEDDLYDTSDSDGMQDAFIPAALIDGIQQLNGAFQYGKSK